MNRNSQPQVLRCDVRDSSSRANPSPLRSWYKDGELVYSAESFSSPDLSDYFDNHPIFTIGVLEPVVLTFTSSGTFHYNIQVENVTFPALLPPCTTLDQARQEVFDLLLGTWTCVVENTLGRDSVTYTFREAGEC